MLPVRYGRRPPSEVLRRIDSRAVSGSLSRRCLLECSALASSARSHQSPCGGRLCHAAARPTTSRPSGRHALGEAIRADTKESKHPKRKSRHSATRHRNFPNEDLAIGPTPLERKDRIDTELLSLVHSRLPKAEPILSWKV